MYRKWLEDNHGEESILYIKFDGPEFILDRSLRVMTEALRSRITAKTKFLLLDKVQLIDKWEEVVNAYYSTGLYEIIITGSNARMLSGELATLLTGRYTEIEMFPLSFKEYCNFRGQTGESDEKLFDDYLLHGGFPLITLIDDPDQKKDILSSILDSILFNDIRPNAGSEVNNEVLTRLVAFLNDATGSPISMNTLSHKIKSSGYKMYYELMAKYMSAFKAAFLYYNAEFHTVKGSARFGQVDPVDTGFMSLTQGNLSENYGVLLETAVFLELKRRGFKINIGKNEDSSEIDFIAAKGKERIYLQVTATILDARTMEREFNSLERIRDNWPKYVLSMDHHDFSQNGIRHLFIPDFLLG